MKYDSRAEWMAAKLSAAALDWLKAQALVGSPEAQEILTLLGHGPTAKNTCIHDSPFCNCGRGL